jgi:hypothetical protein
VLACAEPLADPTLGCPLSPDVVPLESALLDPLLPVVLDDEVPAPLVDDVV